MVSVRAVSGECEGSEPMWKKHSLQADRYACSRFSADLKTRKFFPNSAETHGFGSLLKQIPQIFATEIDNS